MHLSGPGIEAQGVGGARAPRCTSSSGARRTTRGASPRPTTTCATCSPSSCATPTARRPTRESSHYLFEGACQPFEEFDAGTLNGTPILYPRSVHGPVIGTATVDGQPVRPDPPALDVRARRPEPRRPQGHDRGQGRHLATVLRGGQPVRVHVQLGLRLPHARPPTSRRGACPSGRVASTGGCRPSAPATTSGGASCPSGSTPTTCGGPDGLLLNWNNQSAPGFMHGDDAPFGSVHRVELFDQWPRQPTLADTSA